MSFSFGARAKNAALLFVGLSLATPAVFGISGCTAKPVASVNGTNLSEKEFARLTETATEVNPQGGTVGQQMLGQWIGNTLLAQEAKRLNVYPSQADLDARLEAIRKRAAFTGQDLDAQLKQQGLTVEEFKDRILNQMVSENVLLRGIQVSDAEVQKEFQSRQEIFGQPEMVRISQITVDSPAKLKEARNDLGSNADFSLVASTYSRDPFQQAGGKIPQPLPKQVPPGLPVDQKVVDAAFKLKEGQVSEPIQVGGTWVIARLEEKIPAKTPKLEDVKELIRSAIRQQKAQTSGEVRQNQQALMESTRKADIKINRPEYQSLLEQFTAPAAGGGPMGGAPAGPDGAPAGPGGMPGAPGAEGSPGAPPAPPGG